MTDKPSSELDKPSSGLDKPSFEDLPEEKITPAGLRLPKPSSEYLADYVKGLGDGTRPLIGIPSGFKRLDALMLGLDGLMVLAGIPGKGKTSLALQMAFSACEAGAPVLFYSLEMPRRAIYTKVLSRLARVSYTDLLLQGRPYLDPAPSPPAGTWAGRAPSETVAQALESKPGAIRAGEGYRFMAGRYVPVAQARAPAGGQVAIESKPGAIRAAMAKLQAIAGRFYVSDKTDGELSADTLEGQIAWAQAEHGRRALVVIDHLQIFPTGGRAFSGIKDKIDYLVASLEGVKDRTGAAVLAISQKNRAGYYGKGLESLMGSAQIEYTADTVLLLDSKQEQDARAAREPGTDKSELDEAMSYAGPEEAIDLLVSKQRYNAPGRLPLAFEGRYSEFTERKP